MLDYFRIRSLPRALAALVMLATLLLGSVGHAWHHVVDRDCGTHAGADAGPCGVCAGMHAAQLPGDPDPARLPVAIALRIVAPATFASPDVRLVRTLAARAPPAA